MNIYIVDDEELSMEYVVAAGGVVAIILITIIIILICCMAMYRRKKGTYVNMYTYVRYSSITTSHIRDTPCMVRNMQVFACKIL